MTEFTFNDLERQLQRLGELGRVSSVVSSDPDTINELQNELRQAQAILDSMTYCERSCSIPLDSGRRQRVANGAGVGVTFVERFVDDFLKLKNALEYRFVKDSGRILDAQVQFKPKDDEAFRLFTDDDEPS